MSIHPSLRAKKSATDSSRSVMKRHERIRFLMAQGTWDDQRSVLGLPKIKQLKIKSRKAVGKEKGEAATAEKPATTSPSAGPA